ncbi:hypothetical protein BKA63DRAFT_490608 [Paraphoma chrysanthemicola]|nr:hypothetical protein BKA63DRAFT_490608 [Paraphoma chrysanthemicola]
MLPPPRNPLGRCAAVVLPDHETDRDMFSTYTALIITDLEARSKERFQEPKGSDLVPCSNQGRHSRREVVQANILFGLFELVEANAFSVLKGIANLEYTGSSGMKELQYLNPAWIPGLVERLPDLEMMRLQRGTTMNMVNTSGSFDDKFAQKSFKGILEHPDKPFPTSSSSPETADGRWRYQRDDDAIESSQRNVEYTDFWEDWGESHNDEEDKRGGDE